MYMEHYVCLPQDILKQKCCIVKVMVTPSAIISLIVVSFSSTENAEIVT